MKRIRRSMLFVPGGIPRFLEKGLASEADGLIFDLEDAVAAHRKAEVRDWVRNVLLRSDFGRKEKCVRINELGTEFGHQDIMTIVEGRPDSLLLPKVNKPEDVLKADAVITAAERHAHLEPGTVELLALMEMPEGIENAMGIARSCKRVTGLLFGAGDFTRETHATITESRIELYYALNKILCAARAAGIDALDSPCINVRDIPANEREALQAMLLGYDGKLAVHPDQIAGINTVFTPSTEQIHFWVRAIEAYKESEQDGRGATTVDGRLVEMPHVEMAARVLTIAQVVGVLGEAEEDQLEWARTALKSWTSARGR